MIRHESDILCHELRVHPQQTDRESFCEKLNLQFDGIIDNLMYFALVQFMLDVVPVKQTSIQSDVWQTWHLGFRYIYRPILLSL